MFSFSLMILSPLFSIWDAISIADLSGCQPPAVCAGDQESVGASKLSLSGDESSNCNAKGAEVFAKVAKVSRKLVESLPVLGRVLLRVLRGLPGDLCVEDYE